MKPIYRVTVCGRVLESSDMGRLLARAVAEKRAMQRRLQVLGGRALFEPHRQAGESTTRAVGR